jgi:hypothetical protein
LFEKMRKGTTAKGEKERLWKGRGKRGRRPLQRHKMKMGRSDFDKLELAHPKWPEAISKTLNEKWPSLL